TDELADEIVQRAFDRAAADDGASARPQPVLDRLEREGIVAQGVARTLDELAGGRDGLAVAIVGGALAATDEAVVRDLGPHDLLGVGRAARDRERLRQREHPDATGDLHGA